MIRTDLGECGIYFEGDEFIFSPSFYAMSQIGSPQEIVSLLKSYGTKSFVYNMIDACSILCACCPSRDQDKVISMLGHPKVGRKGRLIWALGKLPVNELGPIQILASNLISSGVIGKPNKRRVIKDSKPLTEFNATEYASAAMATLSLSRDDAWNLTMIEFQSAIDTMQPVDENSDQPTPEELDALFAHTDAINEKLNNRERG